MQSYMEKLYPYPKETNNFKMNENLLKKVFWGVTTELISCFYVHCVDYHIFINSPLPKNIQRSCNITNKVNHNLHSNYVLSKTDLIKKIYQLHFDELDHLNRSFGYK